MKRGNCYVTCEALYHLMGGKAAGWKPMCLKWENDNHWYLQRGETIVDPTASQFKTTPDYALGKGKGFLTKAPSRRARELMAKMLWQVS
jgi:hypothetical protein